MTDDKIALRALLENGSDTTFPRKMIGFAAERLIQIETDILSAAPVPTSGQPIAPTGAAATVTGRPGSAP